MGTLALHRDNDTFGLGNRLWVRDRLQLGSYPYGGVGGLPLKEKNDITGPPLPWQKTLLSGPEAVLVLTLLGAALRIGGE